MSVKLWRVWCNDDNAYVQTWAVSEPFQCPIDINHVIDQSKTVITREAIIKHEDAVDPTINDDVSKGFVNECVWTNQVSGDMFQLQDHTEGAAVWLLLDGTTNSNFGEGFHAIESDPSQATTSRSLQERLKLTTSVLSAGNYRVTWFAEGATDLTSSPIKKMQFEVCIDDVDVVHSSAYKSSDDNVFFTISGYKDITTTSDASHFVDVDFKCNSAGMTARLQNVRLSIWRLS